LLLCCDLLAPAPDLAAFIHLSFSCRDLHISHNRCREKTTLYYIFNQWLNRMICDSVGKLRQNSKFNRPNTWTKALALADAAEEERST
jgi:hypothetical protein